MATNGSEKEEPSSAVVANRWGRHLKIHVALPSGRGETISILRRGNVVDLKIAAQRSLGQPFLRLAAPDGRLLDPTEPLRIYGLKDGDSLTAVAQQPKIAATSFAFAMWCAGAGRVVTWGDPENGGDSSRVQDQLRNVRQICGIAAAFAAILKDGSVVTWGEPRDGGDSSSVQDQLRNVQQICGTCDAFAAILADGSIVTWGDPHFGGDSSRVQHQLRNVQQICGTEGAFAALLADGTVVTWGNPHFGGDSSSVQDQLKHVQQICGTSFAFAAILADGTVVTWGIPEWGGDSSRVQDQLRNVQQICATGRAFAAILADGSVVTWGDPGYGGDSSKVHDHLRNVQKICRSGRAFAAILADGSVVTWGDPGNGCDSSSVQDQLKHVQQICGTERAFATLLADGTVVTWGIPECGGDSSRVQDQLRNVQQISGTQYAFAAILADGSVVTWGHPDHGGLSYPHQLCLPDLPRDHALLLRSVEALFVQAGGKACTYHPNPMSYVTRDHLDFFHFIGRVIGKAIHDAQNLEAWFTRGFYKHMLGKKVIAADLEAFDPEYFSNLKWMLDNDITDIVELYFCAESDELGQMKVVDLKPNGRTMPVTNENKYEYIQLMSEHKMTNSVRQQIDAFLKGLHEIVPPELLSLFDDKELELLISGLPDIDIEDLKANTEFWKVLSEFSQEQRAWFLQFATGTSRVPVEGFKGLVGMRGPQKFCIHKAFGPERLPSAHTCFNQLDLPDYPSEEVLREKLLQAVHEGHEGFGFA
eukprot:s62_g15.t1